MSDIPASPKLLRLEAQIKSERDRTQLGCLRAERAGFLGRQGFFDAARAELAKLQKEFAQQPDARVSVWIQIAEGWVAHYDNQPGAARDRMKRAYALGKAASIHDLQALSAAWLAHFAYSMDDVSNMASMLAVSKALATEQNHGAQSRMRLVFGLGYHYIGRFDLAGPWYKGARQHAAADNDDAAISTITYNMTYRRAFHQMVASIRGTQTPSDAGLVAVGAQTSRSFEDLLGISSVGEQASMIEAMNFSATGRFAEAIEVYIKYVDVWIRDGLAEQQAAFFADLAWCYVNEGNVERATVEADRASGLIDLAVCIEDRYLASGRLAQTYEALGIADMAAHFKHLESQDFAAMAEFGRQLGESLDRL